LNAKFSKLALAVGMALVTCALAGGQGVSATQHGNLKISIVDVEGGAATLFLTPEGKSLLIDTGWPDRPQSRSGSPEKSPVVSSADRITAAAASLGIKRIDYLLVTHYHVDHVGGLESLLKQLPVDTFIDHGPNREMIPENTNQPHSSWPIALFPGWVAAFKDHKHITMQTGESLKIGSLDLKFIASDGVVIPKPLPGAGQPNSLCSGVPQLDHNGGEENVRSLGMLITFGKTHILNLGDLNWNKELELLCPANRIGKVDVYFVTGHGMDISSSPPTAAFDPLVAIMQNGSRKGGDAAVVKTLRTFPHLEGLWQEHAYTRNPELNGDPDYIANLDQQPDKANPISMEISPEGQIKVTNTRNEFSKSYIARAAQKHDAQ
jgi:beta-lactamase superfamily II metal-dependent hydrolase